MYLVSAAIGSYNSTDYLQFLQKEKEKENVPDLKLEEKNVQFVTV